MSTGHATTFDVLADAARLNKLATTPRRDVTPEGGVWFLDHPLRKALAKRGINQVGAVTGAIIEWLESQP